MKNLLMLILNLILFIQYITISIIGLIWYGKLNKVSPYHYSSLEFSSSFKESFNDIYIQGNKFNNQPTNNDLLNKIHNDVKMRAIDVPIFDAFGEKIGTQSIYSYVESQIKKL